MPGGSPTRKPDQWARSESRILLALGLAVLGIVLAAAAAVVWGLDWAASRAADLVPPAAERVLGEAGVRALTAGREVAQDDPRRRALEEIWGRVAQGLPSSPYRFRLHLVEEKMVNAVALPGGEVVVFTGLLPVLESPEELAGILAHEARHVLSRHGLTLLARAAGVRVILGVLTGDAGEVAAALGGVAGELLSLSYGREAERDADRGAVEILVAAGIDPAPLARFFARPLPGEGTSPSAGSLFATHPGGRERAEALEALAREKGRPPYRPLEVDWEALQGPAPVKE
jgi:predicted Zn-dependent protease